MSFHSLWKQCLAELESRVRPLSFQNFLQPLKLEKVHGGVVTFAALGTFAGDWVRSKHAADMEEILSRLAGRPIQVVVEDVPNERSNVPEQRQTSIPQERVQTAASEAIRFQPDDSKTFDTFIQGANSQLAYAACRAVADGRSGVHNPLFLYGPSGCGKTHLLHAICHEIRSSGRGVVVAYTTAQQFTEDYVLAIQSRSVETFRRRIRKADVWLMDDVQYLKGRHKTEDEVYHIFNAMKQEGRLIVMVSDRSPQDLIGTDVRLRSRLQEGLMADITYPDTLTRQAIVLSKARAAALELDPEIAYLIAGEIGGSVRYLEGALNRIVTMAQVMETPVSRDWVADILARHYANISPGLPPFNAILENVAEHCGVHAREVMGTGRRQNIALARHITVYLTREIRRESWKQIGTQLGGKDHTTMMHGHNKIKGMLERDAGFRRDIDDLIRRITDDNA
ncbi:MAG: chromosomal replication initiator protein DnaA [Fimbriimonadaceae bacterium]|nr:chromosomal replication initiator protein DnaA [Fimbriimonadaceae bacterium]